jgi:hypothetical protein
MNSFRDSDFRLTRVPELHTILSATCNNKIRNDLYCGFRLTSRAPKRRDSVREIDFALSAVGQRITFSFVSLQLHTKIRERPFRKGK